MPKNMIEQTEYSGKLLKRLRSVSDRSQLIAVEGLFHGSRIKSRHLNDRLPPSPVIENPVEVFTFNAVLPNIMADLLFVRDNSLANEGYVEGIGGIDFGTIPSIALEMAQNRKAENIVIRVVQGATTTMPLRALSYMLPALVLMEQLQKEKIQPPQLQLISAHNISGQLNGTDLSGAYAQAEQLAYVERSYIKTFFPSLVDLVTLLQDTPLNEGSVLCEELIRVAGVIKDKISPDIANDLRTKRNSNGASPMSKLFYAAAHMLIHDTTLPGSLVPIIPDVPLPTNATTIISMGGKQEEFFYKFRHEVKKILGGEYQRTRTLQYFTRHHVPPYYMALGGDVSLDYVLANGLPLPQEMTPSARFDLNYLKEVSNRRGDFAEFIEAQRRKAV